MKVNSSGSESANVLKSHVNGHIQIATASLGVGPYSRFKHSGLPSKEKQNSLPTPKAVVS